MINFQDFLKSIKISINNSYTPPTIHTGLCTRSKLLKFVKYHSIITFTIRFCILSCVLDILTRQFTHILIANVTSDAVHKSYRYCWCLYHIVCWIVIVSVMYVIVCVIKCVTVIMSVIICAILVTHVILSVCFTQMRTSDSIILQQVWNCVCVCVITWLITWFIALGYLPWATLQEGREGSRPGKNASHDHYRYHMTSHDHYWYQWLQ